MKTGQGARRGFYGDYAKAHRPLVLADGADPNGLLGVSKNHRAQSREWKGFNIPILTEASQLLQGWVQWITGPTYLLRPLVKPQEAQQQHDPSQKEDKKEAEQPQNLLGIHQLECHGDHALRWFLPFGHDLIE